MSAQGLSARLSRIEATKAMRPRDRGRIFTVITAKGDEAAAHELAASRGFEKGIDMLILRTIVTPVGQKPYSEPPQIRSITGLTQTIEAISERGLRIHDKVERRTAGIDEVGFEDRLVRYRDEGAPVSDR